MLDREVGRSALLLLLLRGKEVKWKEEEGLGKEGYKEEGRLLCCCGGRVSWQDERGKLVVGTGVDRVLFCYGRRRREWGKEGLCLLKTTILFSFGFQASTFTSYNIYKTALLGSSIAGTVLKVCKCVPPSIITLLHYHITHFSCWGISLNVIVLA